MRTGAEIGADVPGILPAATRGAVAYSEHISSVHGFFCNVCNGPIVTGGESDPVAFESPPDPPPNRSGMHP